MPIAIVATPGAADANSFITEAEFIAYLSTRLNIPAGSSVSPATTCTENEKKAMIEATRDLNDIPDYNGERASTTQALAWPRIWAENTDAPTLLLDPEVFIPIGSAYIVYFGEDEIPQRLKDASCELALQYVKAGTTDLAVADPNAGVTEKTIDVISTSWDLGQKPQGLARFPRVVDRIQPLRRATAGSMEVVRV